MAHALSAAPPGRCRTSGHFPASVDRTCPHPARGLLLHGRRRQFRRAAVSSLIGCGPVTGSRSGGRSHPPPHALLAASSAGKHPAGGRGPAGGQRGADSAERAVGWAAREVVTDEAAEVAMEEAALRARPAHRSGGGPPRAAQETKLSARPRLDGREGGAQQAASLRYRASSEPRQEHRQPRGGRGSKRRSPGGASSSRTRELAQRLAVLPDNAPIDSVMQDEALTLRELTMLLGDLDRLGAATHAVRLIRGADASGGRIPQPDCFVHSKLMAMLARKSATAQQALDIFAGLQEKGTSLDVWCYNGAIAAAGKVRNLPLAFELLEEMGRKQVQPDVVTYTSLIKSCQSCGEAQRALGVLQLMRERGVPPNVKTFTTLISALAKAGEWQRAMDIFEEMDTQGVEADVHAFNALITACAAANSTEQAYSAFRSMRKRGIAPNIRSCNALMSALERSTEWERAMGLFQKMQEGRPDREAIMPNLVTCNTLLSCLGKAGRLAEALEVYGWMKAQGMAPDSVTCTALMVACDRGGGEWQAARALFAELQDAGVALNTQNYNALLAVCSKCGQRGAMLEVFGAMQSPASAVTADAITFSILIIFLARTGDWEAALARFDDMRACGLSPNESTFNAVLTACEEGQQWRRAVQVTDLMAASGVPRNTMDAMVRMLMPTLGPLAPAAQAAVNSGRAARRWIDTKAAPPPPPPRRAADGGEARIATKPRLPTQRRD
eukprot:jgi/Tetstr1/436836/TSEL_025613.t2